MISFLDAFMIFGFIYLFFGVASLVIWGVMLLIYMEEIDCYFNSPDFPHRGVKGLWPWEMGRAASYGAFLLFTNSRFVRKRFPHARENIKIEDLPKKIKFMVAFPMYTYIPSGIFILVVVAFLKIKNWFF